VGRNEPQQALKKDIRSEISTNNGEFKQTSSRPTAGSRKFEFSISDFLQRTRKAGSVICELPRKIGRREELHIQRRAQVWNEPFAEFD
jgi:hypothetical protein